jgi:hypothetical protein
MVSYRALNTKQVVHCDIVNIGFIVKKIMKIRLPCEKIINDVLGKDSLKRPPRGVYRDLGRKMPWKNPSIPCKPHSGVFPRVFSLKHH